MRSLAIALAAWLLSSCAGAPLPRGCSPSDFALESVNCNLAIRAGQATAADCKALADEREAACQGAL